MNYFRIILISSILLITAWSCQEPGMKGDVKALENQAQDLLEDVEALDANDFNMSQENSRKLITQLTPFLENLNKPSVEIFAQLADAEKGHRKMKVSPEALIKELNFSLEQIQALSFELEEGSLSQEKKQKYFEDEKRNLAKLDQASQTVSIRTKEIKGRYKRLIPIANHIVDSLKNVGSISE